MSLAFGGWNREPHTVPRLRNYLFGSCVAACRKVDIRDLVGRVSFPVSLARGRANALTVCRKMRT